MSASHFKQRGNPGGEARLINSRLVLFVPVNSASKKIQIIKVYMNEFEISHQLNYLEAV